jgi:hypothetical protein
MISRIGESAGAVWQYLNQNPAGTPQKIQKSLGFDEALLYMAIGWLAREGKLTIEQEDKTTRISLVQA